MVTGFYKLNIKTSNILYKCSLVLFVGLISLRCSDEAKVNAPLNLPASQNPAGQSSDALAALDCRGGSRLNDERGYEHGSKIEPLMNKQNFMNEHMTQRTEFHLAGDLRHIPAEDLLTLYDNAPISLCGVIRANPGVKLAVIQFVSLDCYSCMKSIDKLYSEIDQYGLDILQIPVFTGNPLKITQNEFNALKGSLAPQALWLFDGSGSVWKFFTNDPGNLEKVNPMTLAMDTAARGFVAGGPDVGLKELIEEANKILNVGLVPFESGKEPAKAQ